VDFDGFLRRLGTNVQRARWAAGLSQEQVAARGLTYRYYQEIERGQKNTTVQTLFTIARILDVTVAALVEVDPAATARSRERLGSSKLKPPPRGRKPKKTSGR